MSTTPPVPALPTTEAAFAALAAKALRVRSHIVKMATRGGCFIGASLSCADLLVHLYSRVLRVAPGQTADPQRDYLFLSKGHDVPALYATLAECGFFARDRLANHLEPHDLLYWHPNRAIPGVEFHSGSLGHLLAVGIGVAMDVRLRGGSNRVFVILGDGELNEGSVWEACLVAAAHRLDQLVVVVDRNGFQANAATEDLIPLEPLAAKFEAFGWATHAVDGHSLPGLEGAFQDLPRRSGQPTAVIARTVRGKGIPSLEGRVDRWFADFSAEEVESLLGELRGEARAALSSEGWVVR